MAKDELNNTNQPDDLLGLESESLDALKALENIEISADNKTDNDGTDDEPKTDDSIDSEAASDESDPKETNAEMIEKISEEDPELAELFGINVKDKESKAGSEAEGKEGSEQGKSADGSERPKRNPQRRPDANRYPNRRRRPDQRPRPDGKSSPNGKKRPVGEQGKKAAAANGAKRPRPEGETGKNGKDTKKKGWTKKKKAILITVVTIVLTLALIVGVILILFFRYTGLLNREPDTKVNSGPMPIASSEYVSKADTINVEDQEAKLKEMLSKRSTPISNENVMNILLVGEDLRDTADGARGNTDVQLLVSINKEKKKIVLASFMRDEYVYLDKYGNTRLNAAYYHEGMDLLKSTISKYFDVKIDRYIMVNFYSFIEVIESIGGIDVEMDKDELAAMPGPMSEQNRLLKNPVGKDYPKKTGKLHLNGNQALGYARIRYGCGDDYGRTQRQREVITEVIKKVKKLGIIELDELITRVAPQITTDVSNGEIASLILNASEIAGYQVCQVQMPTSPYFKEEVINNMAVLVPDYDKNAAILKEVMYGDSTTSEQAVKKLESGEIQVNPGGSNTAPVDDKDNIAINSKDYAAIIKRKT